MGADDKLGTADDKLGTWQKIKRDKLGAFIKVLTVCQALLILVAGVFGTMVHFKYMRTAENYVSRVPCEVQSDIYSRFVHGPFEDRKFECAKFVPGRVYRVGDYNLTADEVTPYLSNVSYLCQAKGSNEIFQAKTCSTPLAPCQIWNLSNYDEVGFNYDSGLGEIGAKADSGLSQDVDVDTGKAAGKNIDANMEFESNDRCGLTEDGYVDTAVVYKDTEDQYKPSIPRPLIWMIYRFIGLDKKVFDRFLSLLFCARGKGRFVQLMAPFPFLKCCTNVAGPLVDFFKFSINTNIILSTMSSMTATPCDENAECVSNTGSIVLSFGSWEDATQVILVAIIIHMFVLLYAYVRTVICWQSLHKKDKNKDASESEPEKIPEEPSANDGRDDDAEQEGAREGPPQDGTSENPEKNGTSENPEKNGTSENPEKNGTPEEEQAPDCFHMSSFGKGVYIPLAVCDVVLIAAGIVSLIGRILISGFSLSIALAFSASLSFNVEFSIDIVQAFVMILIPLDIVAAVLTRARYVLKAQDKAREMEPELLAKYGPQGDGTEQNDAGEDLEQGGAGEGPRQNDAGGGPEQKDAREGPDQNDAPEEPEHKDAPEEPEHNDAPEEPEHNDAPEEPDHKDAPEEPDQNDAPEEPDHKDAPEEPRGGDGR